MTYTSQHPYAAAYVVDADGSVRPVKVEAERDDIDPLDDPEFIPMDVFINPKTMREHFHYSSPREEKCRVNKVSAR